jgi:hypothetical protein
MRKRSTTTLSVAIALAAASLGAGGCGGTDLDLGGGDGEVPAGGYAEAAGAICTQVADRFAEAQADAPRTFAQGGEVIDALLDIAREGEEQLASLEAPAESREAFGRYLDARAEVVALLERAGEATGSEDGEAYERARRDAVDGAKSRAELAKRAGLKACARIEGG